MAYPIVLYFTRDQLPPLAFVIAGISLVLLRAGLAHDVRLRSWRVPLLFALALMLAIALLDAELGARFYPVVMSLAAAAVFGVTLLNPPSLIERLARLKAADLPDQAISYCRTVTWVWTIWLLLNAAIAAALALAGMDAAWALWTGIVAYVIGGILLAGEWIFRRQFHAQVTTRP